MTVEPNSCRDHGREERGRTLGWSRIEATNSTGVGLNQLPRPEWPEKASSTGAGADPVPGHWQMMTEPVTWSRADLRQQTLPEKVQGSNC